MEVFWFWAFVLLLVIAIFAWPTWPYRRARSPDIDATRGYAPSALAAGLLLLLFVLFWFGIIAVWWPWAAW